MSRSTFPKKVDSFTELFDLPADKFSAAQELQQLKRKTVLDNNDQNRIQALTAQLQEYMITPETMNKLQDSLVELETFFDKNVRGYILGKQSEWDQYVNDFEWAGTWSKTKKYNRQNIISYDGNLYICIKNVVADSGNTPDKDTDHYRQVAYKGDKGDIGLNAIYRGEWDGSTAYHSGDSVTVRVGDPWRPVDMVFIAKKDSTGQKPTVDAASEYWFPYHNVMVGSYDFEATKTPIHPSIHYIQVLD